MSVPRGTTPTLVLTFTDPNLDLTTASNVYVTLKNGTVKITKTGDALEVEPKKISVFLSQTETLGFPEGAAEVQANWIGGGKRAATEIAPFYFSRQLLDEVLQ